MPQIINGKSPAWVAGEIVTAAELNSMVDAAILDPSAVTAQTNFPTLTGNEYALIVDPVSGLLKKTQLKNSLLTGNNIVTGSITNAIGGIDITANTEVRLAAPAIYLDNHSITSSRIEISTDQDINVLTSNGDIYFNAPNGTTTFSSPVTFASTVNIFPSGVVFIFANTVVPTGWAKCNGVAVSRTSPTYSALFAAIGTTYGAGDGVSTFNLPDLRGEFVRGWDDGRGVDTGRAIGSAQDQQLERHKHIASNNDCTSYSTVNGVGTGTYNTWCDTGGVVTNASAALTGDGGHTEQTAKLGTETRPRNKAMMYCIKL